jgi:HlyD family secretion protein
MKKNHIIIIIVVVVALIVAAVIKSKVSDKGTKVAVKTAEFGKVVETVSANGKVQPEVEVIITPDVPGEIIELPVIEGQKVKKGDLLARIDPEILESAKDRLEASVNSASANLANSKARLAQAKARLINSETNYKRNESLIKDKAISQADFDAVKAEYEVAKAEVEAASESVKGAEFNVKSARAGLREADENLLRTQIYSPMDGVVSKLVVEKGERVVGTSQMAGTEIMRIADLQNMEVNVEVNESDIIRVSLGDTANIEVDAYLDRKFTGIVTEIANSAQNSLMSSDQVTSFEVKIRILRSSYIDLVDEERAHLSPFRPGMSAAVDIKTQRNTNALLVPIQAVTLREDTTSENKEDEELIEVVFVHRDGKAYSVPIITGIQDSKNIEVKEGIAQGDEVIFAPYSAISKKLENENEVIVVEEDLLFEKEK